MVTQVKGSVSRDVEKVNSLSDLTQAPSNGQQIVISETEDSEGRSLLYVWDSTSTSTPFPPAVLQIEGVAQGRLILQDYNRNRVGRNGETVVDYALNMVSGFAGNTISSKVHSSTISGGGNTNNENVIGGLTANVGNSSESNVDPTFSEGLNARYCWIGGGYDNVNNGLASGINGQHCFIESAADHATISGGSYNSITDGPYNTISGGTNNQIKATSGYSCIGSGGGNTIETSCQYSVIQGGSGNTAEDLYTTISGGQSNTVSGSYATVGGGSANSVTQERGVISGGNSNTVDGSTGNRWGSVLGGFNNTVLGEGAIIIGGRDNEAQDDWSSASGYQALAIKPGSHAVAAGQFNTKGDAQKVNLLLKAETSDDTETILKDALSGADISSLGSTAISFRVNIVGKRTDVDTAEGCSIVIEGLAVRASTGVWSVTESSNTVTGEVWSARVYSPNAALRVAVTGEAAKNIQWFASLDYVQSTGLSV